MKNAEKEDDIDLFIITEKDTIWTTRVFVILLLKLLGRHRSFGQKNVKDKFCTNMFVDETYLSFQKNIYMAHEIVQLMPIYDKANYFSRILAKNKWIKNFMPNTQIPETSQVNKSSLFATVINKSNVEKVAKKIELSYMKTKISSEKINDKILFFHPNNNEKKVLNKFKRADFGDSTRGH